MNGTIYTTKYMLPDAGFYAKVPNFLMAICPSQGLTENPKITIQLSAVLIE
mgnify:CR=1 FL=1